MKKGEKLVSADDPVGLRLRQLYWVDGLSLRQVAKRFGVKQPTICRAMRDRGIPRRTPNGKLSDRERSREFLQELYLDEGWTVAMIARHLGVSHSTVYGHLVSLQIPRRSRGCRPRRPVVGE